VLDRGYDGFDAEVVVEGLESLIDELSTVVGYYRVQHPEFADNTSPYEIFYVFSRDGRECLNHDPLGEVVDSNQEELYLSLSRGEGTDDVHSPKGEQPWRCHAMQFFWLQVMQRVELLTLGAVLHIFCVVSLEGRLVTTIPEDLGNHCPSARMVVAYPFVDFFEDILCLILSDALQQRC